MDLRSSRLDDLRIWNLVRTAEKIRGNYAGQLGGKAADLVANWLFDESSGLTAHDATGHGHDGQLRGTAFSNDVHH